MLLVIGLLGIKQIYHKADLPFVLNNKNYVISFRDVQSEHSPILPDDRIVSVNGINTENREEVEILLDHRSVGDKSSLKVNRGALVFNTEVILIHYYNIYYTLTAFITGLIFFFIGLFVLKRSAVHRAASIFHWAVVSTAVIIMNTWGTHSQITFPFDLFPRIIFHIAYFMAPVIFIHFTLLFPNEIFTRYLHGIRFLYLSAIVFSLVVNAAFMLNLFNPTEQTLHLYSNSFDLCRLYMISGVILSLNILLVSYQQSASIIEKKKLKWILFGLFSGPGLFILFWVIPQAVFNVGLFPEEFIIIAMIAVPVSFAIAIIKYHIFNIDHIINRSIVYTIAMGFVTFFYIAIVFFTSKIMGTVYSPDISFAFVAVIAFLFNPLKNKIQKHVDKIFFRVKYNFRIASKNLLEEMNRAATIEVLSEIIMSKLEGLFYIKKYAFLLYETNEGCFRVLAQKNFINRNFLKIRKEEFEKYNYKIFGDSTKTEPEINILSLKSNLLKKYDLVLVIPVWSTDKIIAAIILGPKTSGDIYTIEDIDLFTQISLHLSTVIERIQLYESIQKEKIEEEKLIELNQLKTLFLSSVSHELKTPLTSIKMFAELLESNELLPIRTRKDYFGIIQGECSRLTRLIESLLDISRIERGIIQYNFSINSLKELICYTVEIMSYQIKKENCRLDIKLCNEESYINCDYDRMIEVLENLISNSLKYSYNPKSIGITLSNNEYCTVLEISNNGPSISENDLLNLCQPFYRSMKNDLNKLPGSGLGLYLVKQIISAHNGSLDIINKDIGGCTFKIELPKEV